jgi:hypothetical protein
MLSPEPHLQAPEQVADAESERAGDLREHEIRRVRRSAFDAPDVVLVDASGFRESFLSETNIRPELTDSLSEIAE